MKLLNFLRSLFRQPPADPNPTGSVEEETPTRRMFSAIRTDDLNGLKHILSEHPELRAYSSINWGSLLAPAAHYGSLRVAKHLLQLGLDVNRLDEKGNQTALWSAIANDQFEMAELLLQHGADPNLARAAFAAIRRKDEALGMQFMRLLVAHGLELDRSFPFFGEQTSILEFAEANDRPLISRLIKQQLAGE